MPSRLARTKVFVADQSPRVREDQKSGESHSLLLEERRNSYQLSAVWSSCSASVANSAENRWRKLRPTVRTEENWIDQVADQCISLQSWICASLDRMIGSDHWQVDPWCSLVNITELDLLNGKMNTSRKSIRHNSTSSDRGRRGKRQTCTLNLFRIFEWSSSLVETNRNQS